MCGLTSWSGCVTSAAKTVLEAMAGTIADATAWIVVESLTWWIDTDSSATLNAGVVDRIKDATWPLTVSVAVLPAQAGVFRPGTPQAARPASPPCAGGGVSLWVPGVRQVRMPIPRADSSVPE